MRARAGDRQARGDGIESRSHDCGETSEEAACEDASLISVRRGRGGGRYPKARLAPLACRRVRVASNRPRRPLCKARAPSACKAGSSQDRCSECRAALCAAAERPSTGVGIEMGRERPRLRIANPAQGESAGSLTPHVSVRSRGHRGPISLRTSRRYGHARSAGKEMLAVLQ